MARPLPRPGTPDRSLYLVATDVAGRVSLLAGPYRTVHAAAAGAPAVADRLATAPGLAAFGHVTVAEGTSGSATYFGAV